MVKIKDIARKMEEWAPLPLQETYDNAGLMVGQFDTPVSKILVTLDITEEVVSEAQNKGCELIVAHHPIIFKGLKRLTGSNYVERTVILAIKNNVALYAAHTNLDNIKQGVSNRIAERLGLRNVKILDPKHGALMKLTTFVPIKNTPDVLNALYQSGAGQIGNYKNCSFRTMGTGTFTPNENAMPHIGQQNVAEEVEENRIEVIFPGFQKNNVLKALKEAHPYEEVAYYLYALENVNQEVGPGVVGELEHPMEEQGFLAFLKEKMKTGTIKYTPCPNKKIKKVAICGGAGSFLLSKAKSVGAQAFITGDFKYHEFFDADKKLLIADIGHYESEQFTKDLIYEYLTKNFPNIAIHLSEVDTNPVQYF